MTITTEQLKTYYAGLYPKRQVLAIEQIQEITSGWESDLVSFVARYASAGLHQQEPLILRMLSGANAAEKAIREFQSIRQLTHAGYPVPQVYDFGVSNEPFGAPFLLMERIDGMTLGDAVTTASAAEAHQLLMSFCRLFVQLHQLPWRPFIERSHLAYGKNPHRFVDRWLTETARRLTLLPDLDLTALLGWIEAHRSNLGCLAPTPTHNDFHGNNLLARADGSCVVIDWTGFAISDPRFDLAWTLVLHGSFGGETLREQTLQGYLAHCDEPVVALDAFEVMACIRRLLDAAISIQSGAQASGMRADAIHAMAAQAPTFLRVYERLTTLTGLQVPQLAKILENL